MSDPGPLPERRAPLVLRTPPFHRRVPALGTVGSGWDAPAAADDGDPLAHPLAAALREARVGGAFWGTAPALGGSGLTLVVAAEPAAANRSIPVRAGETLPDPAAGRWRIGKGTVLAPAEGFRGMRRLRDAVARDGGQVLEPGCDPHAVLDRCARIVVADGAAVGELAVLALLRGIPVEREAGGREDPARALALLLRGTRYRDPFSGAPMGAEDAAAMLRDWREAMERNRAVAACTGMAWWKKRRIAALFARAEPGRPPVRFRRGAGEAVRTARRHGGAVATWSTRMPRGLEERAAAAGVAVVRVEDGFIRSLGLGSGLLPPASVVADRTGLYLDPRTPSDLERILAGWAFDDAIRERARRLVARLVAGEVSKYGAGGAAPAVEAPAGKRVVLVPGQVADDLSVRLGGAGIGGTIELLRRVREAEPEAWVVFRPHPDVDAGFRAGAVPDEEALRHADQVSRGGSITRLIARVDAVHTLCSLAGFEAILRGVPVVCWGQPFYSGWGLTEDRAPVARRGRTLRMEELAAGCLLLYPRYIDPRTGLPCGPEVVIDRLAEPELWRPTPSMRLRAMEGRLRGMVTRRLRRGGPRQAGAAADA